jgi:hypothetical protein
VYGRKECLDHTTPTSIWFHAAGQAQGRQNEVEEEKKGREAKLGPLAGVAKQNGMANGTSPMAWLDLCIYSEKWNGGELATPLVRTGRCVALKKKAGAGLRREHGNGSTFSEPQQQ